MFTFSGWPEAHRVQVFRASKTCVVDCIQQQTKKHNQSKMAEIVFWKNVDVMAKVHQRIEKKVFFLLWAAASRAQNK